MPATTQCVTWKMPDALHWNGFCTNELRRVYDGDSKKTASCNLCVTPDFVNNDCSNCVDVPYLFRTTEMPLTARGWATSCFSGCAPYPTIQLATIQDVRDLPMLLKNKCFWQSERLTVASGCGCFPNPNGAATRVYQVIQKSVQTVGGSPVVFSYATWFSPTVNGSPATLASGLSASAIISHNGPYDGGIRPCYQAEMSLIHTGLGDFNINGFDTVGYYTARAANGTFGTVKLAGEFA